MDFEKAFINSWKNALEERELSTEIDFYKIKERNRKLPVPKKKKVNKENNFKISHLIKTIAFFFVILNIIYIILRLSGIDIIKPYGDIIFSIFEKISSFN